MGTIAASAFMVISTYNIVKVKIPGHLVFRRYMILPIDGVADWRCICQHIQAQIGKYVIYKNSTRINHDHRVWYQFMIRINSAFKCKAPFQDVYTFFHKWENGVVTLRVGAVTSSINISHTNPYNIENVERHSLLKYKYIYI